MRIDFERIKWAHDKAKTTKWGKGHPALEEPAGSVPVVIFGDESEGD